MSWAPNPNYHGSNSQPSYPYPPNQTYSYPQQQHPSYPPYPPNPPYDYTVTSSYYQPQQQQQSSQPQSFTFTRPLQPPLPQQQPPMAPLNIKIPAEATPEEATEIQSMINQYNAGIFPENDSAEEYESWEEYDDEEDESHGPESASRGMWDDNKYIKQMKNDLSVQHQVKTKIHNHKPEVYMRKKIKRAEHQLQMKYNPAYKAQHKVHQAQHKADAVTDPGYYVLQAERKLKAKLMKALK